MRFAKLEPLAPELALPWQESPEQEKRFKRLLRAVLLVLVVLAMVFPWLPVFEKEAEPEEASLTKTEVLLEPETVEPEPEPEPEPAPEPAPEPEPEPAPAPEPETQSREVAETPEAPAPEPQEAAPKVDKESMMEAQGLSQVSDELSSLRGKTDVAKLQRKNVSRSDLGQREYSTRDRLGEEAVAQGSQGIQVDEAMAEDEVSLAAYRGVPVEATAGSDQPGSSQVSFLSGQSSRRDMENIRRTFEGAKSRVYSLYLQALNDHPQLRGKFIFRLVIEPDGSVSELELVSSELNLRDLEDVILQRIEEINFGAKEVSPTAVEYAFSFLPS